MSLMDYKLCFVPDLCVCASESAGEYILAYYRNENRFVVFFLSLLLFFSNEEEYFEKLVSDLQFTQQEKRENTHNTGRERKKKS